MPFTDHLYITVRTYEHRHMTAMPRRMSEIRAHAQHPLSQMQTTGTIPQPVFSLLNQRHIGTKIRQQLQLPRQTTGTTVIEPTIKKVPRDDYHAALSCGDRREEAPGHDGPRARSIQ